MKKLHSLITSVKKLQNWEWAKNHGIPKNIINTNHLYCKIVLNTVQQLSIRNIFQTLPILSLSSQHARRLLQLPGFVPLPQNGRRARSVEGSFLNSRCTPESELDPEDKQVNVKEGWIGGVVLRVLRGNEVGDNSHYIAWQQHIPFQLASRWK